MRWLSTGAVAAHLDGLGGSNFIECRRELISHPRLLDPAYTSWEIPKSGRYSCALAATATTSHSTCRRCGGRTGGSSTRHALYRSLPRWTRPTSREDATTGSVEAACTGADEGLAKRATSGPERRPSKPIVLPVPPQPPGVRSHRHPQSMSTPLMISPDGCSRGADGLCRSRSCRSKRTVRRVLGEVATCARHSSAPLERVEESRR